MTQTDILPATKKDLPLIQRLARRIWSDHYPGIITQEQIDYMLTKDYALKKLEADIDSGVMYLLLHVNDQAEGFAAWGPTDHSGEAKLHKIYLSVNLHGKGFGSQLLAVVEKGCISASCHRLILQVNKQNHKAIKSYNRNGFIVEREIVVDIGHGFVMDDFLMTKNLEA